MATQETYWVLYRTYLGRSETVLHSLHATREEAEEREQIERAFDNNDRLDFTYRVEGRNAEEIRVLMAALDARNPNIDPLLRALRNTELPVI